jgi:hypothetical protein
VGAAPIYVEIRIRGAMDELWSKTQAPELHQRWDLRFTDIAYLPHPDPAEPQRFLYATRIGFGLRIAGAGESVGSSDGPAGRASALRFWSDDWKSLIRAGSGYWKYVPANDGLRFLTRYEYETRFGAPGALVDRLLFRPLLGWATAWSFDRLRLWIERGVEPEVSLRQSAIHALARGALAFAWIYQGIVPKLLFRESSGEFETVRASGLFAGFEARALTAAAVVEIALGALTLLAWRSRAILAVQAVVLVVLGAIAAASDARLFTRQFDPATLSVAMLALAACAGLAGRELPSASRCLRKPPGDAA